MIEQKTYEDNQHNIATELKCHNINEYIFAPFDTFVFLDSDEIFSNKYENLRDQLIEYLTSITPKFLQSKVQWMIEKSDPLKASKGVFSLPGSENSFISAKITDFEDFYTLLELNEIEHVYSTIVKPINIQIYFNESGVGSCSLDLSLTSESGLSVNMLDKISESLNNLYKEYLEDICYELTMLYVDAIKKVNVPHFTFSFIPDIKQVEKAKAFLPWTHRIYHVDDASLFELENPGEPFKSLLTPIASTDVKNFAVYPNRYIYFGWGHSLILSMNQGNKSQPEFDVYNYIRLVQIAQTNWHCLDNISKLIDLARISFYADTNKKKSKIKILTKNIIKVRNFTKCMETILDSFDGINITFDTEKRRLLDQLHKRWLQQDLIQKVRNKLTVIEEFLDFLYVRKKEQRDGSLNTILSVITIISIVEVIKAFIEFSNPVFNFAPEFNLLSFVIGSMLSVVCILFIAFRE
ncbi:hypothetical protein [Aquibacillus albus]|uniref:Uncharacterized protein n=1 Tax=Aquibacillus albus TaxID=1168171 RepID=A0ABS2N5G0_9BACI|nr:hypothetical protein [Aquibacillus albus]MBM7573358.1 hypothetical protein [Aquibacillus albus]